MSQRASFILLVGLFITASFPVCAEINRWVDENGQVHYDDQPRGQATRKYKTYTSPPDSGEDTRKRHLLRSGGRTA